MSTDQEIEQEIQAKGLTAPRVTPADIKAEIVSVDIVAFTAPSGQVLRWAVLTTRNGYAVTGRPSVAVSSANDDEELGKKIAIDNAVSELWPLMGYALKQRLAGPSDEMVSRFLGWQLPADFHPDCHITFDREKAVRCWPYGTNLLDASQAREMLAHVLAAK